MWSWWASAVRLYSELTGHISLSGRSIPSLRAAISLPSRQGVEIEMLWDDKDRASVKKVSPSISQSVSQSVRNWVSECPSVSLYVHLSHSSASFSNSLPFLLFCACLFLNSHRLRRGVAMATVAPPFFLLCWLLRAASTAFPEELGPLNFIPTEGTDLPTFHATYTTYSPSCLPPGS